MCVLFQIITVAPFCWGASKTYILAIKEVFLKFSTFKEVEDIGPLISCLIRVASRAGHRLKPIPGFFSVIWRRHRWGSFVPILSPLWVHGIPTLPLSRARHRVNSYFFHKTKSLPNPNLSFPTAGSPVWALSVFWIISIPLDWPCCFILILPPTPCLSPDVLYTVGSYAKPQVCVTLLCIRGVPCAPTPKPTPSHHSCGCPWSGPTLLLPYLLSLIHDRLLCFEPLFKVSLLEMPSPGFSALAKSCAHFQGLGQVPSRAPRQD